MDTEILSRIQFAFTIGFHIIFPTLNLGLALFLTITEAFYLRTQDRFYLGICQFWTKIFALTFGMGVVSGIVLSYELGTNFGPFSEQFGPILGALFAYEVLTAFFLEAGFLGIMLFGWHKVGAQLHFLATLLVCVGTTISAFWIMSANSWMQTPAGYEIIDGQIVAESWLSIVFNPSFIPRFIHMMLASYVTTGFILAGISGYYILKARHLKESKYILKFASIALIVSVPLQMYVGHDVGLMVYEYQPLKTAAMEALWQSGSAPLVLFAIPDATTQQNLYEIAIPGLASLLNTGSMDGEMIGLSSVSRSMQPVVLPVFFGFRIMVGIGIMMFGLAIWLFVKYLRDTLCHQGLFHYVTVIFIPAGLTATIAGWITAESGRQPWIVHGLAYTRDTVSNVDPGNVFVSLMLFVVVYGIVFGFYLYYVAKLILKGYRKLDQSEFETHLFQYMNLPEGKVP